MINLEVRDGSFSYGRRKVLDHISYSIRSGEILAVLGPNGIGKTTLLKCTMGLVKWDSGQSYLDGRPLAEYGSRDVWKRIAYVPQAKAGRSCTAHEMVLLGRSSRIGLFGQPGKEDRGKADEALSLVHMEHLRDKLCSKMSGGELQMVLIARALAAEPELLILDEPESNLDFRNQLLVLETIKELSGRGIASIMNTHYPEHALKIADKAIVLNDDLTSLSGKGAEVLTEENLTNAFRVDTRIRDNVFGEEHVPTVIPLRIRDLGRAR